MAHNDIEIEIKVPVEKEVFLKVKEEVKKIARFVKKSKQVDDYFTPKHRNFVEPRFPFEWLSVRERDGTFILNYKHFHPENVEVMTHCDEFETEVKSKDKLEKIFSALDLRKLVTVKKKREVFVYNDEFEIALDDVTDLGYFVEIETIKDFGSVEVAREKLMEFFKKLGIDTSKADKRGYPYLLMEKKGLIK